PVLILDEPTIGLDPKQIIEVRELIKSLGSEHTIILSTHILPEVSMTCSRVVIINEGKLVAMDTPENLTARLQGSETVFVEVEGPIQDVLGAIEKMEEVISATVEQRKGDEVGLFKVQARVGSDIRKKLASLVVNSNWGLLELRPEKLSLEEIFLKLTTKEEELN
ncbi:MAG: ABC transporter ATP-binding protein, partial [Candidatus Neomarinimicrobiota bacterium]